MKWTAPQEQLATFTLREPAVVDMGTQLSSIQKTEIEALVSQFADVFEEFSGQTNVIHHEICTPPGFIIRQWP